MSTKMNVLFGSVAFSLKIAPQILLLCALLPATGWLPPAHAKFENPHGVAVVIGNQSYALERVPEAAYAHRDADAFRRYVLDVLGFNPDNVLDLRDATRVDMESVFGTERNHQGTLWRYLHPHQGSDVVVYYSGHGAPGPRDGRAYLLPVDADPDTAERGGYMLDNLYANLTKLEEATSVRVFIESSFSGDSDAGMLVQANAPTAVPTSPPEAADGGLTVLTAASGDEVAWWDKETGHGLFTHHLLAALYGAGDSNGDGEVTAAEVKTYLDNTMTLAARRTFGRQQNAGLHGPPEAVLAWRGGAEAPALRPVADGPEETAGELAETAVSAPTTSSEEMEDALALTHAQFVQVQKGLNALGFDVGAADGKFGPRTRAGIVSWQSSQGKPATGYLDADAAADLIAAAEAPSPLTPEDEAAYAAAMQAAEEALNGGDHAKAAELTRPLAEQGNPVAQYRMGDFYFFGDGVSEDYGEAVRWFRLAADQGYAKAQDTLGRLYYAGDGVSEDKSEAVRWFRLAADQGFASAQRALGVAYFYGEGVPEDNVRSFAWFILAAAQGDEDALRAANSLREEVLTPAQVSEAETLSAEIAERIGVEGVSVSESAFETAPEQAPSPEPQVFVPKEVIPVLDEALSAAERIGEDSMRSTVFGHIALVQAMAGDDDGARRSISEALSSARLAEPGNRPLDLAFIVPALLAVGDREGAARSVSEALSIARSFDDDFNREFALSQIAGSQAAIGDIKGALSTARSLGGANMRDIGLGESIRNRALGQVGRGQMATGDIAGALTTARSIGDARLMAEIGITQADAYDIQGSIQTVAEALSMARKISSIGDRAEALASVAQAQVAIGDNDGATRSVAEALTFLERVSEDWERDMKSVAVAGAQAAVGDIQGAMATLRSRTDDSDHMYALSAIAEGQAIAGDIQGALTTARSIADDFHRGYALSEIARALLTAQAKPPQ